jgi:glyoxylase I family protein
LAASPVVLPVKFPVKRRNADESQAAPPEPFHDQCPSDGRVLPLRPRVGTGATLAPARITQGYGADVAFVTDGGTQFHLATRDFGVGFRHKQAVNPLERGHIAFRTDDIEAFKKRLEAKGIPYADYGTWSMKGWYQIFFHDPEGNVIEVHQADE